MSGRNTAITYVSMKRSVGQKRSEDGETPLTVPSIISDTHTRTHTQSHTHTHTYTHILQGPELNSRMTVSQCSNWARHAESAECTIPLKSTERASTGEDETIHLGYDTHRHTPLHTHKQNTPTHLSLTALSTEMDPLFLKLTT